MAIGEWSAQVHPRSGGKPHDPVYFSDFASTLAFVKSFQLESSGDRLRVHVPGKTTDRERRELEDNGATIE